MKNICATGPVTPGYDVSHYQPNLHVHAQQAALGKKFCLIKCDEGTRLHDDMFKKHWLEAKKQGMVVGAYNFFHPAQDPTSEANDLINLVGTLGPGDLGAICDNETDDGLPARDREAACTFLAKAQDVLKKSSWYYGGPYFTQAHINGDHRFLQFPLWVAHYGARCPLVPEPWTAWTMWQFSSSGGLDKNVFNGSLDQLKHMAGVV